MENEPETLPEPDMDPVEEMPNGNTETTGTPDFRQSTVQDDGSQGGSVSFPWNTVYAALGVIAILGGGVVIALVIKHRSERYYDEENEEERE